MRKIFLVFLASAAIYPPYSSYGDENASGNKPPLAKVVASTPGKPVNVVGPVVKYVSHTTASAYNALNPFAGGEVQMAAADNTEYAPGSVSSDFPGVKPHKPVTSSTSAPAPVPVSKNPNYTVAKTPPKYSMKPIVEAPKDEPPEDFDPNEAKKAKTKAKEEPAKKTKAKTLEVKKDKKVEKPAPAKTAAKKPAAAAAPKAAAKPTEVKAQVVKVEENAEAAAAAKAKAPAVRSAPPAKAVVKETPKPSVKAVPADEGDDDVEVEVPKVEAKTETKAAPVEEAKPVAAKTEEAKPAAKVEAAKPVAKEVAKAAPKNVSKITPKAEFSKDGDVEKLKFTFSTPTAAAVFERFGYYWLVFYSDDKIDMPDIKKSQIFDAAKKVVPIKAAILNADDVAKTVQSPLIYRLEMVKNAYAMAEVKDTAWEISFDPGIAFKPDAPLKLAEKPEGWLIESKGITAQITAKDDFTNDYIEILPLADAGFNPDKVTNAKFVFEKTVQGLVIKPIGQVEIKSPEKGKVLIVREGGAAAPTDKIQADIRKPNPQLKPIFAFQKWPQLKADDYRKAEQKLRLGSNLEFGKFLFSQGLYSESAVNLQGERGFEASFLTGASYYMLGRFEDALKVFDSLILPSDVDPNELLAWRAASNFELGQVNPNMAKPLDMTNFYLVKNLDNYPDEIRNRLLFSLAEKLIADGKFDDAQNIINVMPKTALETPSQSYMKYLQAKLYDGQNKKARAREIWVEVAKSATDRESQAKSSYEVIIQDYNAGKIKLEEAISKLNDIRILWRGDIFEYTLLGQLADMYAKNNQPYEALKTYKEILSSFPNFPHNIAIANTMRDIYAQVVANNFSDKDKTFAAVTIYYEFEELKPAGEKGDQMTLQLADALAKYDLLGDAVKVLQKYAATVVDPAQKAEIGTRIAILQYLDNKPKDSLQTLQDFQAPNLPNYLVQERRILMTRCLIEANDLDKAIGMLSSLPDEQANRFRADIYWKQKKWPELVSVYDLITDKNDEDIMRLAIGNVMIDDKKALQKMAKKYAATMAKSPYSDSFDYVTDTENVDFRNLNNTLQLDKAEGLMAKYRERIKNNGLASVTGKNEPPPKTGVTNKTPEPAKK